MTRNLYSVCVLWLFGVLPVMAAPGTLIKEEELRAEPGSSAAVLARLARDTPVDVVARQGGWTQIHAQGVRGWVRILSVRTQVTTGSASDLAALASRRDGRQVVAVAGLRGLNEEELKAAKFDAAQLVTLEQYRATPMEAAQFARAGHLRAHKIAYLAPPKTGSSGKPEATPDVLEGFQ